MILKMTNKIKIAIVLAIGVLISLFMIFGLSSKASTLNEMDKTLYNVEWDSGTAKHWTYYTRRQVLGINTNNYITYNFIRLEDKNGELIDSAKITRLAAKYEIDGKVYTYSNEIDNDKIDIIFGKEYLEWDDLYAADKEGILIFDDPKDISSGKPMNSDKTVSELYDNFESCNLIWLWCLTKLYVTDIMELYVWYEGEPEDNQAGDNIPVKESAISFVHDENGKGLHPMYDENGEFLGIYDADGKLMEGYSLSEVGMICNVYGTEIDLSNEQTKGSFINVKKSFFEKDKDNSIDIEKILSLCLGVAGCIALIYVASSILKLFDTKSNKKGGKRK